MRDDEFVAQPLVLGLARVVAAGIPLRVGAQDGEPRECGSRALAIPALFDRPRQRTHRYSVTRLIITSCVPFANVARVLDVVHQRANQKDAEFLGAAGIADPLFLDRRRAAGRARDRARSRTNSASRASQMISIVPSAGPCWIAFVHDSAIASLMSSISSTEKRQAAGDRRDGEARDGDPFGARRNLQRTMPGLGCVDGGRIHASAFIALCSSSKMPKIFTRPVMSKIFLICGLVQTRLTEPPCSRTRLRPPINTPNPVESM